MSLPTSSSMPAGQFRRSFHFGSMRGALMMRCQVEAMPSSVLVKDGWCVVPMPENFSHERLLRCVAPYSNVGAGPVIA